MMKEILANRIPEELKTSVPIAAFFVEGKVIEPIKRKDLAFASSQFYNTNKMRCFEFYKPAFL